MRVCGLDLRIWYFEFGFGACHLSSKHCNEGTNVLVWPHIIGTVFVFLGLGFGDFWRCILFKFRFLSVWMF